MVATSSEYKKNDFILKTDTAIIVTSHPGHRMFLEATLKNYMKTGKYVILSYDSHNQWPHQDIMNIPHSIVTKPQTYGAEKRIGWLYDVVLAGGLIRPLNNIEAVIITNGDCIWEIPENVDSLRAMVDRFNGDMMCVTAEPNLPHTAAMIMKSWVFQSFIDYVISLLELNPKESYSPEVLLRDFISWRELKNVVPRFLPEYPLGHRYVGKVDHYASYNQSHTWKRLVGFRNLGAEHKAACYEHLEPVDKKYFDISSTLNFDAHESATLYRYLRTGDRRWLYMYWDQGEESNFNRRYFPLDHYGKEPLYNDSKRKELGPMTERVGVFDRWKVSSYVLKDEEFEKRWKKIIKEKYPALL